MIPEEDVEGFDPYDEFDAEAERLEMYLASVAAGASLWSRPSRCDDWTVRDVVAHLVRTEEYHHACLDDDLAAFFARDKERGASTLAESNELAVRDLDDKRPGELVKLWWAANKETRQRFRDRDGGEMATSVGSYPVRSQAFHAASEVAIHADDMNLPPDPFRHGHRTAWRAAFSRGAIHEARPEIDLDVVDGGTRVRVGDVEAVLDDPTLIDAVASRLGADSSVPIEIREALAITP